jgi:hypothetical protein
MRLMRAKSGGKDHYELLKRLHSLLQPATYVEIGVCSGKSLALANSANHIVGIDPFPNIRHKLPSHAKVFRMTSDAFFASHDLNKELAGQPVDFAFIDGMHLFEFALRDFINIERYSSPASVIFVHDCYPIDSISAKRDRATPIWSGDVWKLLLCLKKYRPDLKLITVDVPPTGMGIIRNLDPKSITLSQSLEKVCQEFIPYEFEYIARDKAVKLNCIDNEWSKIRALFPLAKERTIVSRLAGVCSTTRLLGRVKTI